jgi:hypothetical protein
MLQPLFKTRLCQETPGHPGIIFGLKSTRYILFDLRKAKVYLHQACRTQFLLRAAEKKTGVFKGPLWAEKITTAYFYWLQAEE